MRESYVAKKGFNKVKNSLDPLLGLPNALQIWFPIYGVNTRLGIQIEGAKTISFFVQQSLEPNGDFNSQIRFIDCKLPSALVITIMVLSIGGFLTYLIEKSNQEERQAIIRELNIPEENQGSSSLTDQPDSD